MIREGRAAFLGQPRSGFLHTAAAQAVNNAGVGWMFRGDELPELLATALAARFHDPVADVRTVEAGNELLCVFELQFGDDVGACALVGRRGQSDARHTGESLRQHAKLPVLGTEVMSPGRDAVGLIDGDQADAAAGQQVQRPVLDQSLRRDVHDVEPA